MSTGFPSRRIAAPDARPTLKTMPFAGSLGTLPLPDILNTLHNIHATGVLRLESRVGSRDVAFNDGEIIAVGNLDPERSLAIARRTSLLATAHGADAGNDGNEESRHDEAVNQIFNLFAWHDAQFAFSPTGVDTPDVQQLLAACRSRPLRLNIQHVLMEAARQQDEWAALRARIQQESIHNEPAQIDEEEETRTQPQAPEPAQESAPESDASPLVNDEEWQRPILSDDELAPTPWNGDGEPAGKVRSTGSHPRPTTNAHPRPVTNAHVKTGGSSTFAMRAIAETSTIRGVVVGPFRISSQLDALSGNAHRAKHVQDRSEVALKIADRVGFPEGDAFVSALQNARLLAAIHHPCCLPCLSVGETNTGIYAAFSTSVAQDLASLVEKAGGPLAESEVVRLGIDCAYGLQAIHQRGMIHRDLRPDNLFTSVEGRGILGPFALRFAGVDQQPLPRDQLVAGFSAFTAIEVMQGIMDIDHRADMYSLACSLFFLATGQPPYHAAGRAELAKTACHRPVPDARDINRQIGEPLARVLKAAMAKNRTERHPSIDAFIADLLVIASSLAPANSPFAEEESSSSRHAVATSGFLAPVATKRTTAINPRTASIGSSSAIRRATNYPTGTVRNPGQTTIRRAIIPQPQPITSIVHQPPPEPAQATSRSWNLYDVVLILLVVATVVYTVSPRALPGTLPASVVATAPTTAPTLPALHLPRDGHRLLMSGDPWAECVVDGTVTIAPEGATFTGTGALRASEPLLNLALSGTNDFSIAIQFTALQAEIPGEATLFSLARGPLSANFAIGQIGSALEVRCRTSATDAAGNNPHLTSPAGAITGGLRQRLVFVRQTGRHVLYLDGAPVAWTDITGDLSVWDAGATLTIGREPQGQNPWIGIIHELVVWPRALNQADITKLEPVPISPRIPTLPPTPNPTPAPAAGTPPPTTPVPSLATPLPTPQAVSPPTSAVPATPPTTAVITVPVTPSAPAPVALQEPVNAAAPTTATPAPVIPTAISIPTTPAVSTVPSSSVPAPVPTSTTPTALPANH